MATGIGDKIVLGFGWVGPNRNSQDLDIGIVDLKFKNATTKIRVDLPTNICPNSMQPYSFTCRKIDNHQETYFDWFNVTVDQIRNLTLKVGYFRRDSVMDRTESRVAFEVPNNLEIGKTYRLVLTSDNLSIKAQLIREEIPPLNEEAQLQMDQQELSSALNSILRPLMNSKISEFGSNLVHISPESILSLLVTPFDPQLEMCSFKKVVSSIDKSVLKETMQKVRSLKTDLVFASEFERQTIQKQIYGICFNALGVEGLKNIMRMELKAFFPATVSASVEQLINHYAEGFQHICMSKSKKVFISR